MPRHRPARLANLQGINVDKMGALADSTTNDLLRLENLDVNIPPDPEAIAQTHTSATTDKHNSYLPFIGQLHLRNVAAKHVAKLAGIPYSGARNCVISAGGLSGILNVLMATVEEGDEVIVTDPTYRGLTNRVCLAGGTPMFVPFEFCAGGEWRLDQEKLRGAVTAKTRAMLLMSPSMPSGGYFTEDDWKLIAELCVQHDILLILDTAMERLVFDKRPVFHPAGLPGMSSRTITIGSSSKELRMIGWRVGWIVGPEEYMPDITAVSLANVIVPVGIAQEAVAIALDNSKFTMKEYVDELQARRDLIVSELEGLPVGVPAGGWSLLLRVTDFGVSSGETVERLLQQGICVTAMDGWGVVHGSQYVRLVFSNESLDRLRGLGGKVRAALGLE